MRKLLLAISFFTLSQSVLADRTAVADDGREVRLKDNGSWEYISNDRLATSKDGMRVRLKENGSWEFIGNAPMTAEGKVRTQNLTISLDKVITEFTKKKVGAKVERYNSQTVFYLDLDVSAYGDSVTPKLDRFDLIEIHDNDNNHYPVISTAPKQAVFETGKRYTVEVRIDGSLSDVFIRGKNKARLTINKQVFGSGSDLVFNFRTDDIDKKHVDSLP